MEKFLNNKTILVCGGAGFMGSNFIIRVLNNFKNCRIINLDLLTYAGNPQSLSGINSKNYTFIRGDIGDTKLVRKLMAKADYVINFAAETHVDRSIHGEAASFVKTNILGVQSLLEALAGSPNIKKMIQISTDEVWGDLSLNSKKRFNEESKFLPNSPYAASKASGDLLIRSYVRTYKLPVIVSHSVNNFGPRQFPEKLIPFFTLRAMQGKRLPLYGDGLNVRDWVYVDDHTDAIILLLNKAEIGGVYAISGDEEYSNIEIAKKILRILKKPESLITFVRDRPAHDRRYSVDSSNLKRLGWKPKFTLEKQLKFTIDWYGKNKKWVQWVINKQANINKHIKL